MSEEIKNEVKGKVQELFKLADEKKKLLARLEIINKELVDYGIEETTNQKSEKSKVKLTEDSLKTFMANGQRNKGEFAKNFKGIAADINKQIEKFVKSGVLVKLPKNGNKQPFKLK